MDKPETGCAAGEALAEVCTTLVGLRVAGSSPG